MARYLVTGGAGFIGSNVVRKLVELRHDVCVLENFLTGKRENLADVLNHITLFEGDIRHFETVLRAGQQCDYILHLAALPSVPRSVSEPLLTHDINLTGTLNILEAAKQQRIRRVVFSSSSSVYGDTPTLPKQEEMPVRPLSPYAAHKAAGEMYCAIYARMYQLETVCLRYFNVFGPRQNPHSQYAAVIPKFITALQTGAQPTIYGDGEQSRDFTYIDNVVAANLAAATAPNVSGEIINIACGQRITINALAYKIASLLQKEVHPQYEPPRPGDVKHSLADISKAKKLLKYENLVDIETGLQKTIEWFVP